MQFIFLYYDANRNGKLEVEEAAFPPLPAGSHFPAHSFFKRRLRCILVFSSI